MATAIRRILFPTDFSESAHQAGRYARLLATQFQAELHALHILPEVLLSATDPSTLTALPEGDRAEQLQRAQSRLHDEVESAAVCRTVVGVPVQEILTYADEAQIDLIVVGTHGLRGLSRLLLGSVAEKLVRMAKCPVLTVPPHLAEAIPVESAGEAVSGVIPTVRLA